MGFFHIPPVRAQRVELNRWCSISDLPPLKWSSLKYVLPMEDEINGEETAYG